MPSCGIGLADATLAAGFVVVVMERMVLWAKGPRHKGTRKGESIMAIANLGDFVLKPYCVLDNGISEEFNAIMIPQLWRCGVDLATGRPRTRSLCRRLPQLEQRKHSHPDGSPNSRPGTMSYNSNYQW